MRLERKEKEELERKIFAVMCEYQNVVNDSAVEPIDRREAHKVWQLLYTAFARGVKWSHGWADPEDDTE